MPTYTSFQSSGIVESNYDLSNFVSSACGGMKSDDADICRRSAAFLYQTCWLDRVRIPILDSADHPNKRIRRKLQMKELKRKRSAAVALLQEDGVVPSGFAWIFVVRWFVLPFLMELLKKWTFGFYDDEDEDGTGYSGASGPSDSYGSSGFPNYPEHHHDKPI